MITTILTPLFSLLLLFSGDYTGDMHVIPSLAQEDSPAVSILLDAHDLLQLPTTRR